jgi:hypothetical protein
MSERCLIALLLSNDLNTSAVLIEATATLIKQPLLTTGVNVVYGP